MNAEFFLTERSVKTLAGVFFLKSKRADCLTIKNVLGSECSTVFTRKNLNIDGEGVTDSEILKRLIKWNLRSSE